TYLVSGSREVGLWDAGGALIASAIVTTGDPQISGFYGHQITPVALDLDTVYIFGWLNDNGDSYGSDASAVPNTDYVSAISSRISSTTTGTLTFPEAAGSPAAGNTLTGGGFDVKVSSDYWRFTPSGSS